VVRFVTHWMGLPIPGSPLIFPSPNPSPISPIPPVEYKPAHIPLERGGAGVAAFCSAHPGCWWLVVKPTSLIRGEGLIAGLLRVVGRVLRVLRMDGGGGGMNQYQP
jgi:hypothetical protein